MSTTQPTRENRGDMRGDELRVIGAELRAIDAPQGAKRLAGYAAVFNSMSEVLGDFREQIAPGAFLKTITEADVRFLFNHDANEVLGRSRPGKPSTLTLREDGTGLWFELELPDTQRGRDLPAQVARGDVDQCSFGFKAIRDKWDVDRRTGDVTRTLLEAALFDVSLVVFPAYAATSAQVRSRVQTECREHVADRVYVDRVRYGRRALDRT